LPKKEPIPQQSIDCKKSLLAKRHRTEEAQPVQFRNVISSGPEGLDARRQPHTVTLRALTTAFACSGVTLPLISIDFAAARGI
jgi:hypothetical protein